MKTVALLSLLSFVFVSAGAHAKTAAPKPNIVIILSDDHSADDLGFVSKSGPHTPILDAFAAAGMRFANAYASAPQCSPSRSSILTGRSSHATGTSRLHSPLTDEHPTILEALKKEGYYVGAIEKVHLGEVFQSRWDFYKNNADITAFLHDRPKDRPFFLWVGFHEPHRPYKTDPAPTGYDVKRINVPGFLPDDAIIRRDLISYYAAIEQMDGETGEVLKALENGKVAQDTIVFFVGDNGMPFPGAKGTLYDAGVRVPFLVRWPGHVPAGVTRKEMVSLMDLAPTWLELAGAAPLPRMEGRSLWPALKGDAIPARPVFFERNWHDNLDLMRGVRSGRYFLIHNYRPEMRYKPIDDLGASPTWKSILDLQSEKELPPALERRYFSAKRPEVELFDLENDPFQLQNLADAPAQKSTIQELDKLLSDWMLRTNDFLPPPIPPERSAQGEDVHP